MILAASIAAILPVHVAIFSWDKDLTEQITIAAHSEFSMFGLDTEFSPTVMTGQYVLEISASILKEKTYRPRLSSSSTGILCQEFDQASIAIVSVELYVWLDKGRYKLSSCLISISAGQSSIKVATVKAISVKVRSQIGEIYKNLGSRSS